MSVWRGCARIIIGLGLVLPLTVRGADTDAKKLRKLIVYPSEGETVEQLKAGGAAKVDDYGAFWVVKADKSHAEAIQRTHGTRSQNADYLDRVDLAAARFDTTVGEPDIPSHLREMGAGGKRLRLVQFSGPVQDKWIEMLKSAGRVRIVNYVPNNTYLVQMDQAAEEGLRQLVEPNGPIQWIGKYHPYYKIQKGLSPSQLGSTGAVDVRIAVINDADADAAIDTIRRYALDSSSEPFYQLNQRILSLRARAADLPSIAQMSNVLWIERVVERVTKDERQDLLASSHTNQLPGHSPIPILLGGESYLEFLDKNVGAGLAAFTNSATYPIVDIADTGLETGTTQPVHPAFYELGDKTRPSRVAYVDTADSGCPAFPFFISGSDFCGHGTFVASIVAGYDAGTNELLVGCTKSFPNPQCVLFGSNNVICVVGTLTTTNDVPLNRIDSEGFQRGMGISPFGLIGTTRIFSQDLSFQCNPYSASPSCSPCATSLPVLMSQEYRNRARIANNSWGDDLVQNPDGTFVNAGAYTADSQSYDIGVRDALLTGTTNTPGPSPLNQELIAVFAAGDAGTVGNVGGFGDILVTAPATAKNIIAVGATENFRPDADGCLIPVERDNSFDVSGYSAFGPTLDGRFKPDILAPGSAIFGAANHIAFDEVITDCSCDNGRITVECHPQQGVNNCIDLYSCVAGTSFSAPAVSGGAQLLWWYFQNRLLMLQPSPAMVKAYMLNSARYLPIINPLTQTSDTLPSIAQGMGMMDLERMFDGVPRALRDESTPRAIDVTLLLTNPASQQTYFTKVAQSYEVSGTIADPTQPFRVTVAWTDVAGTPATDGALVNNLDLEVTVGGQKYKGNIFANEFSVVDINRGADTVNNVESVFLPSGLTGAWSAVVRVTGIAGDGVPNVGPDVDQDFALVVYNTTTPSDVPNPNTNDTCQTAAHVAGFPYTAALHLSSPTFHNNHPSPSAATGGIDAFWALGRPTQGTVISANTIGSNFDTVLSVWTGDCGSLVEVTSNNNASNSLQSAVSFVANGFSTYYIVVDKRAGNNDSLVLHINAVPPPITLTPSVLDFGTSLVGVTTASQTATYSNGSTQVAVIDSVLIEGADAADFAIIDGSCEGQTIAVGGTCFTTLSFTPSHVGAHTATLVINDNQTGSPRTVLLTGFGLPPAPLICKGAAALSFPDTLVGAISDVLSVTITNCGTAPLVITNLVLTGANAGDFVIDSDTCGGSIINPGIVCTVGLRFVPTGAGSRTASLRINDSADGSPHTVTLAGKASIPTPAACASPSTVAFGNVLVGELSTTHSVTISNCGSAALVISNITITGAGASQYSITGDTCSSNTLLVGQVCTVNVVFHPTIIGAANAALSISDNAAGSPQSVALTGIGTGSQPDALISRQRKLSSFVGDNIYSTTGDSEAVSVKAGRGKKKVFYVRIQNDGNVADSFQVHGGDDVAQGYTVRYFLGAVPHEAMDITAAVKAGTFTTSTMAGGATTGDATLIRVEMRVDKLAITGFLSNLITLTSTTDPGKTDTVKATLVVP